MKTRAIAFAFAAILVSSFAFADSPTDAPLMPNDDYAVLLHPLSHNVQDQDVQTTPKAKQSKKKGGSAAAKARTENPSQDNHQKEQSNPRTPATNGNFAGSN